MQLNKNNYVVLIDKIISLFNSTFGKDLIFIEKQEVVEHMGYFKIQFRYLPLMYDVIFESERDVFCIDIYDEEGAKNSLYRIERFDNRTNVRNAKKAIQQLKNILQKNEFCFYITRHGVLYRKNNHQYERVTDLGELLNKIEGIQM